MLRLLSFLPLVSGLFGQATATEAGDVLLVSHSGQVTSHTPELKAREKDLNSFLQASVSTHQGTPSANSVRFFLGKGKDGQDPAPAASAYPTPTAADILPPDYWKDAAVTLGQAGMSTPLPASALVNMPPLPPTPKPWDQVLNNPGQPLDTKVGGAIMSAMTGPVTPTPPPSQRLTDVEFVAQCPMVMFYNELQIKAPSCGDEWGKWFDPNPYNPRVVTRWQGTPASGLKIGVDSAISGEGDALFAEVEQMLTLNSYKFKIMNCLGVDRWHIEEEVYKVDSVGKVTSTMELHDVNYNSVAYFFKYIIKKPTGQVMAESSLYRASSRTVTFTEVNKDGINTGVVLGSIEKLGSWKADEWRQCMDPSSPRAWKITFPVYDVVNITANGTIKFNPSVSTVQDIRVAMTTAITLMAKRDEGRADGLNTSGGHQQMAMFAGGIFLTFILCIITVNCCMVFKGSGIKSKLQRTSFDFQEAVLPKAPSTHRQAPLHPVY